MILHFWNSNFVFGISRNYRIESNVLISLFITNSPTHSNSDPMKTIDGKDLSQAPKWVQEFIRQHYEIIEKRKKRERGELPPLYKPEISPEDKAYFDKIIADTEARNDGKSFLDALEESEYTFFDDMTKKERLEMLKDLS